MNFIHYLRIFRHDPSINAVQLPYELMEEFFAFFSSFLEYF